MKIQNEEVREAKVRWSQMRKILLAAYSINNARLSLEKALEFFDKPDELLQQLLNLGFQLTTRNSGREFGSVVTEVDDQLNLKLKKLSYTVTTPRKHWSYRAVGFLLQDGFTRPTDIDLPNLFHDELEIVESVPAATATITSLECHQAYDRADSQLTGREHWSLSREKPSLSELISSLEGLRKYESVVSQFHQLLERASAIQESERSRFAQLRADALEGDTDAVLSILLRTNSLDNLDHLVSDSRIGLSADGEVLIHEFTFTAPNENKLVEKILKNGNKKLLSRRSAESYIDGTLYSLILRAAHNLALCTAGAYQLIVCSVFQEWIVPETGRVKKGCIASIQASPLEFIKIIPERVDPEKCFRSFSGIRTPQLSTPVSVTPSFVLDKNDNRIIDSRDIETSLDNSTNLATLDWEDFEHLVRQFVESLYDDPEVEVRLTQASRDKGVDAIVFDPHPIRGGKVLVQAKRYTNTVEASAVRDLYGTVVNEGANSGLLITTSSFGPDARAWAMNKPLKLIDGQTLLALLAKSGKAYRIDLNEAKALQQ